jgi:branched-chain amino acid transport system substrate-binding protein
MAKNIMKMMLWLVCFLFLSSLIWTAQPLLAKEKKEIFVGASLPISGPLAMPTVEQKWAYEQAVADINKAGGVFVKEYNKKLPVRLKIVDDQADPGKAASVIERLIKRENVDFLLGGHTPVHDVLPGLITAEKYQKVYLTAFIWVPMFLEHNFKWGVMFFFDPADGAAEPYKVFNTLPQDQRPTKMGLLMEDSADGKIIGDLVAGVGEKFGYKVAVRESMGLGAKDFTTQVLKCKEAGVDAIFLYTDPPECITLIRQMKENKYSVKFFVGWKATWPWEFYQALKKDAEYVMTDGFWSQDFPFPGCKELGERYSKKFKKHSVAIGMLYSLPQILSQAIEKAGTLDGAKVREAILANEFDTMVGKVKFSDKGVGLFPQVLFQWWNGKLETVFPFEYTKYKAKVAPPWDKR